MTITKARMLDKLVTIKRRTKTPDGMGGFTLTKTAVDTNVKARIMPISTNKRIQYQQLQYPVTHDIIVPGGTDVREGDEIVYGNRTFEVRGTPIDPGEQGRHLEIEAEEKGV